MIPPLQRDGDDLRLRLKVRPGARSDAWRGTVGDRLKLDVAAAPEKGVANARLLLFLAAEFGVGRDGVVLIAGAGGRTKEVRVTGPTRVPAALAPLLDGG